MHLTRKLTRNLTALGPPRGRRLPPSVRAWAPCDSTSERSDAFGSSSCADWW